MTRDLPKTVPIGVLAVADATLEEGDRLHAGLSAALDARASQLDAARAMAQRDGAELEKLADDLFHWAVALRRQLPSQALHKRFRTQNDIGPAISVANHEIALPPIGGVAGGKLRTELELNLFPDHTWLFRRYEWFDGHNVHGGDQLNTVASLRMGLHPLMLRGIHGLIAEGEVWTRVEYGLRKLLADYKDR